MALTKTITLKNNFGENSEFDSAYLRIERIEATKHLMKIELNFYKNGGKEFLSNTSLSMIPDFDGPNFFKQAYLHLKTLPEFSNAIDC